MVVVAGMINETAAAEVTKLIVLNAACALAPHMQL